MGTTSISCANCGNVFIGKFCNECGEKVYTANDKSFKHFFAETTHFLTHLDSKFLRTLWLIFRKPGLVSKEYCEGKRKKYFKPVSLFLIVVLIYLLFPMLQGMNISFANHLHNSNQIGFALPMLWAKQKAANKNVSLESLAKKFDSVSPKASKILLISFIPLTALALNLLWWRKKKFFFDHYILSAEFNTVYLFLGFILMPLSVMLVSLISGIELDYGDTTYFLVFQALILISILTLAFRRFYHSRFLTSILKSIVFLVLFMIVVMIYRIILFTVIMIFI